ncbi:N-acetyltransferase [bacterium]|nr:MAG: N-acetyltransferase [bacterium]
MEFVRLTHLNDVGPLAAAARTEGFNFLDRLVLEWNEGTNRFDTDDKALFGAYAGGELVGTAGLTHQRPGVGRVRRVYVNPAFRRRGIARRLMAEVLRFAEGKYDELVLFTDTERAAKMYERLGFVPESSEGPDHATHRLRLGP